MQYLLIFQCNNGFTNGAECYILRTLSVLFILFIPCTFLQQQSVIRHTSLAVSGMYFDLYSLLYNRIISSYCVSNINIYIYIHLSKITTASYLQGKILSVHIKRDMFVCILLMEYKQLRNYTWNYSLLCNVYIPIL